MTWIGTASGRRLDYLDPRPDQISIDDIAVALSRAPRFCGHTRQPYSVARHSINAVEVLQAEHRLDDCRLLRGALLHDASEAYMGDLPTPLKALCPRYRAIEDRLMRAIAARFGFDWPLHPLIKRVDGRMLMTERLHLQPDGPAWSSPTPPPYDHVRFPTTTPDEDAAAFLAVYAGCATGGPSC